MIITGEEVTPREKKVVLIFMQVYFVLLARCLRFRHSPEVELCEARCSACIVIAAYKCLRAVKQARWFLPCTFRHHLAILTIM